MFFEVETRGASAFYELVFYRRCVGLADLPCCLDAFFAGLGAGLEAMGVGPYYDGRHPEQLIWPVSRQELDIILRRARRYAEALEERDANAEYRAEMEARAEGNVIPVRCARGRRPAQVLY